MYFIVNTIILNVRFWEKNKLTVFLQNVSNLAHDNCRKKFLLNFKEKLFFFLSKPRRREAKMLNISNNLWIYYKVFFSEILNTMNVQKSYSESFLDIILLPVSVHLFHQLFILEKIIFQKIDFIILQLTLVALFLGMLFRQFHVNIDKDYQLRGA